MSTTKTVFWDRAGNQHEGYIKDGQTYMDEAGTTRVPVGSTVKTAGGTYKMTANGGIPTSATSRNLYEQNSRKAISAYDAAGEAQRKRIESATDAVLAEINRQKVEAEENYKVAEQQAREQYREAISPFGANEESLVRLGLDNSGFSESSKLKLASDYARGQVEARRALDAELRALEVSAAEARANGQNELASIYESRAQNILNHEQSVNANLFSDDANKLSYEAQIAASDKEKKYDLALAFLENGISATFVADTLGIPQSDVDAMNAAVRAAQSAKVVKGGNASGVDNSYLSMIIGAINASGLSAEDWLYMNASSWGLDNKYKTAIMKHYLSNQ